MKRMHHAAPRGRAFTNTFPSHLPKRSEVKWPLASVATSMPAALAAISSSLGTSRFLFRTSVGRMYPFAAFPQMRSWNASMVPMTIAGSDPRSTRTTLGFSNVLRTVSSRLSMHSGCTVLHVVLNFSWTFLSHLSRLAAVEGSTRWLSIGVGVGRDQFTRRGAIASPGRQHGGARAHRCMEVWEINSLSCSHG